MRLVRRASPLPLLIALLLPVAPACKNKAPDCEIEAYPERKLRLLNRREYSSTVRDLMPFLAGGECSGDADCDLSSESCTGDVCAVDPCALHTFTLPAASGTAPYDEVLLAGTFNDWNPFDNRAAWTMEWAPSKRVYYLKTELADAGYQYKYVTYSGGVEDWIEDPGNPHTTPDGFGENNSVVIVQCAGAADPAGGFDPAADFPIEGRPSGYAFDNNAEAGLVTSVHVSQYLAAGERIAELAVAELDELLPCESTEGSACAEQWIRSFGKRAFRRPLTAEERDRYLSRFNAQPDFETGVSVTLQVMLSSPYFLYRFELGEEQRDGSYLLDEYEIATALSYLFWGTMPDPELTAAADDGLLREEGGIEAQARRLLEDPRARDIVGLFAAQWLGVEKILTTDKSASLFPEMTPALRAAMLQETQALVKHVVFDSGGAFEELFLADYGFMNADLARLYDIDGVSGSQLRPVSYPHSRRSGLLGHGSVLATYAHSDQSSPIRRGLFIRQNLLCQHIPDPPANAGGVPEVDPEATTRERFRQHTDDPFCAGCHYAIDPVGFGFERFDALGKWRTEENGDPIDASGDMLEVEELADGSSNPYASIPELAAILADADSPRACFTRQWYRYAAGALDSREERCSIDKLDWAFAQSGGDIIELLVALTTAEHFLRRSP